MFHCEVFIYIMIYSRGRETRIGYLETKTFILFAIIRVAYVSIQKEFAHRRSSAYVNCGRGRNHFL